MGQSASREHMPVNTQRPSMHSTPLAMHSAVERHSGGGTQRPASHTSVGGHITSTGQRRMSSQNPRLHSCPAGQSVSREHVAGGSGMHAPSTQTGAVGGHSGSLAQPPGTTHVRERQTIPGKGQSSSVPQRKGGRQRRAMQRQPVAQSLSAAHVVGWQ